MSDEIDSDFDEEAHEKLLDTINKLGDNSSTRKKPLIRKCSEKVRAHELVDLIQSTKFVFYAFLHKSEFHPNLIYESYIYICVYIYTYIYKGLSTCYYDLILELGNLSLEVRHEVDPRRVLRSEFILG
ncbi:unnamed protein product [Gongylonema pulchrum]|uniref:Uncharacterized protein n=1 Tax=Gongylonema pulchrum TaxID=637853 RepID=A0A183DKX5_9BILA|nr:unnamed protein product [Gongylonema pulchrum]